MWKIIDDNGKIILVDLPKITYEDWIEMDGIEQKGWEKFRQNQLTYLHTTTYYENFYENEHKDKRGSSYERSGCVLSEGDVVVDIGANIGCFSRYALTKKPSKVLCIEPLSLNIECLKYNTKDTICEILPYAVSDKNEYDVELSYNPKFSGGSNIIGQKDNHWTYVGSYDYVEMVQSITLDSLFENGTVDKIDFLKIDVEGSELLIFDGLSDENLSKINKIAIETKKQHKEKIYERTNNFSSYYFDMPADETILYFYRD